MRAPRPAGWGIRLKCETLRRHGVRKLNRSGASSFVDPVTLLFHIDEPIQTGVWHVHLGVLADGAHVVGFQKRLERLRRDAIYAGARSGYGLEFHGYEMLQQKGDWEGVGLEDAIILMRRALQAIPELGHGIIIRCADLKSVYARRGARCDIYHWMFADLLEHLNERLRDGKELGLVIADEQHQQARA